jgi:hypothetical protein
MASHTIRQRQPVLEILTRGKIVVAVVVLVLAILADDWFRWFLLGTVAMGSVFALLGRLGERGLSRAPHRGFLDGGPPAPDREPHPLYDPNKVRLWGSFGAYITAHPVGAVIAAGGAVIVFAGIPEARVFILGSVSFGILAGIVLWLHNR